MIDFKNVNKSYGSQDILNDSTFRINRNERVGLVGPNGAGKSTIFGMITGEVDPDKGSISLPANMRIGHLRQQLKDEDCTMTLLEYTSDAIPELNEIHERIAELEKELASDSDNSDLLKKLGNLQHRYEVLGGYTLKNDAEIALSGLGFSVDDFSKKFKEFSGGWQMRASMARVLISAPDILLLDEPSNYLDVPAIEWLQRYLRGFKGTLLLISHDRYLLKSLATVTLEINGGRTTRYPGNYDYYMREREARRVQMESAKKNQDKRREQLERGIERFRSKNTKAAQAQSWMKKLDKMEDIDLPDDLHFSGSIRIPPAPPSGAEMIRLENVGLTYDSKKWIIRNTDLAIGRGEKIAFIGYNGTGKTTLLKILAGEHEASEGTRTLGHKVTLGYQAQEFGEILPPEQSVYDIVKSATSDPNTINNLRNILGSFGFKGEDVNKQCKVLSGGEKIRLCFARIFVNPPNLLIIDEPTTHLDIAAREALQQAIREYNGTVCLVSHDIEFVKNAADIIIAMTPPGITRYHGNYDYYLEKSVELQQENSQEDSDSASSGNVRKERRKERAAKRNELLKVKRSAEKKLSGFESRIEKLEEEKAEITEILSANQPDTDFATLNRRLKRIDETTYELTIEWDKAVQDWEEIQAQYDAIHE